jgi:protein-S-isoprenylcysteine O-methyltransferase Ste14
MGEAMPGEAMTRQLFALLRTLIVSALFVSLWTYFFPRWFAGPDPFANPQALGWIVVAIGGAVMVPCVLAFAWRGLGTPMPLDPPRKLVVSGPYRWVRNPMYVGMGITLLGEAWVYPHLTRFLLIETAIAFALVFAFIVFYEEPTLRRSFGSDYEEYCRNVPRWIPRLTPW